MRPRQRTESADAAATGFFLRTAFAIAAAAMSCAALAWALIAYAHGR